MRSRPWLWTLAWVAVAWHAVAGDPPAERPDEDKESVAGKKLPELKAPVGSGIPVGETAADVPVGGEFEPVVYRGAKALGLEPAYVHRTRQGMRKVYLRDYKGARAEFEKLDADMPGTGIASVMDALVWQALMLENFDFRYDKQYQVASKDAIKELGVALGKPGAHGWENFLMAGMMGIEAIHTVRHEQYLAALQRAFQAMEHVARSREAAPEFTDLLLADGMYNYWRTVITMSSPMLPDFGDHRAEGILQMQEVEHGGFFLAEPTSFALAYTWLEERDHERALESCLRNQKLFPDNVINNLIAGQVLTYMRRYAEALANFDHVMKVDATNNRSHYYRGVTLAKMGKNADAVSEYERYLRSDYLEKWQRSMTHYRLGKAYQAQKQYLDAETAFEASIAIDGDKDAKAALARLRKMKQDGKVTY